MTELGTEPSEVLNEWKAMPTHFSVDGKQIDLNIGEDRPRDIGGYDITPEMVVYTSFVPATQTTRIKRKREDDEEDELRLINQPMLAYTKPHLQGWVPIDHSRTVTIGSAKFVVRSVSDYPLALDNAELIEWSKNGVDINPTELFISSKQYLARRVDFVNDSHEYDYYDLCTIWPIATHYHMAFDTFPFLKFSGPPGCGKTTANYAVASISFHPVLTPDMSDAVFYRIREATCGTVAMDERDFYKKTESRFEDFLNNSFTRGGYVIRNTKDDDGRITPQFFEVFGPFTYSGVQSLPFMMTTRTLDIPMRRTLTKRYSGTAVNPRSEESTRIRNVLYLSRFQYGMRVAEIYRQLNVEDYQLDTRGWDMARPLIAVAMVFAPNIIPEIVAYVNEQVTEREEDATERGEIKVLLALQEIVNIKKQAGEALDKPFRISLTAIKTTILNLFPDEDEGYWKNQRIGRHLSGHLNFKKKTRASKNGNWEYMVNAAQVHDWVKRLRLPATEPSEQSKTEPSKQGSEPSVQTSLDVDRGSEPSVPSVSSQLPTEPSEPSEPFLGVKKQ
ncbi:MAG: hypothetical protein ACLPY5_14190 [Candidatus Bathyarchaeia archaeon]